MNGRGEQVGTGLAIGLGVWGAAVLLPYFFVRLLLGRFFLLGFL